MIVSSLMFQQEVAAAPPVVQKEDPLPPVAYVAFPVEV